MKIFFYITILLFSLGQLGRISFFGQMINGYLYEIPLFLTFLYLLWHLRLAPIKEGLKGFKIIFWFIGIIFFSYLLSFFRFSLFQNLVAFLYLLRLLLYLGFWSYWGYWLKKKPAFRQDLLKGLFIFSLLTIISSWIQYFLYPDLRNLFYLGWDPHLYRMFGLFFDTSVAAAVYGVLFLFFYNSYKDYKNHKYDKALKLIFALFFLVAVVLTFSRSAYFVLALVVIWELFLKKRFSLISIFLAIFFLMIFLAPKPFGEGVNLRRTFSIESRLEDYKQAINIWKTSPLFGIGYNRIRFLKSTFSESHAASSFSSSYLIILTTGGIFGLLGFLASLAKLSMINKNKKIILFFLATLSLTDNIILHPFLMFLLGAVMVDR